MGSCSCLLIEQNNNDDFADTYCNLSYTHQYFVEPEVVVCF